MPANVRPMRVVCPDIEPMPHRHVNERRVDRAAAEIQTGSKQFKEPLAFTSILITSTI